MVDRDPADVERRTLEQLQVVVALDRGDVLGLDEVVALDLARLQRLETSRVVADRPEDDLLGLRRLAPVVVVADEDELLAEGPGLELVRPRARRVLGGVGAGRREDALVVLGSCVGLELRRAPSG